MCGSGIFAGEDTPGGAGRRKSDLSDKHAMIDDEDTRLNIIWYDELGVASLT